MVKQFGILYFLMLDTEESRRLSYFHRRSFLVVLSVLIRQNKPDAIQYCCTPYDLYAS